MAKLNLNKIKSSIISGGSYYRSGLSYEMWIESLEDIKTKAEELKQKFIINVIDSVIKYNNASEKQAFVIARFADENGLIECDVTKNRGNSWICEDENFDKEAKLKEKEQTKDKTNFSAIIRQMDTAAEKLAKPKIRLTPNLVLTRAKKDSKNEGQIYVSNGNWENNIYYGKINTDGSHSVRDKDIIAKITEYQNNPQAYAKAYGDKYSSCSFCGLELTHENSKKYGYGPVCAEKFGLPHTYIKEKKNKKIQKDNKIIKNKIIKSENEIKPEIKKSKTPGMYKIKSYIDNGLQLSKLSEQMRVNIKNIKTASKNFTVENETAKKLDNLICKAPSVKKEIDDAMPKKQKVVTDKKTKIIKTKQPKTEKSKFDFDTELKKEKAKQKPRYSSLLKRHLTSVFPDVKFSVTYDSFANGDAIDVRYDDVNLDKKEVEKITNKYAYGTFDSMTDLQGTTGQNWGAKYVQVHAKQKYPIFIEWSEGLEEVNIRIKNLRELNDYLLQAGFTDKPTKTYIKNKVWFKGIDNYIRIDNSKMDGDFNFEKELINNYLKREFPEYDFSVFENIKTEKKPQPTKKDKIPGGLADGMTIENIAEHHRVKIAETKKQLEKGIKEEMEHTSDKSVAEEIAMDHLFEDIKYYDKLEKIEHKAEEPTKQDYKEAIDILQMMYDDSKNKDYQEAIEVLKLML